MKKASVIENGISSGLDKINKEKVAMKNQERGRPLNDYTRWAKDEEERLIKRYKDGMTLEQLSAIHRRGKSNVKRRLMKLNLIDDKSSLECSENSLVNTGNQEEFGSTPNDEKIANRNKQLGLPMNSHTKWTFAEEKLLINRFNDGFSISQISKFHGRNTGGIRSRLKKLGLIE